MAKDSEKKSSKSAINGYADLEGKTIIDSENNEIGICKSVIIGEEGQIGLTFETTINNKKVIPSQTIPYSLIQKITDVIVLKAPINIKIAKSEEDLEKKLIKVTKKEEERTKGKTKGIKRELEKDDLQEEKEERKEKQQQRTIEMEKKPDIREVQANASHQLSKALAKKSGATKPISEAREKIMTPEKKQETFSKVERLMVGLIEASERLEQLFNLLDDEKTEIRNEAIRGLTKLTKYCPELGLSLIPKMMELNNEPEQSIRLTVAQEMEKIGENKPDIFEGYFIELFEDAFEEPNEEIREQNAKTLHDIASKLTQLDMKKFETFLKEVISGDRIPEVPAKVIHDTTLKVVSGNLGLTRAAIRAHLEFIAKNGKLGERCAKELEDYNATHIGLTIIETFSPEEGRKILQKKTFQNLGAIFIEVINQMIDAYSEGSFEKLEEVIDKKIEIPTSVIERFLKNKITKTLEGVKNVPLDVFLEKTIIDPEKAEQIIYRLVVQKKINASIEMTNGKAFISSLNLEENNEKEKPELNKLKKSSNKESKKK